MFQGNAFEGDAFQAGPGIASWGWEAQGAQSVGIVYGGANKPRRGGAVRQRVGASFFQPWVNAGWEVQPPQPPHPKPERSAAIARGDDGNQGTFNFWKNAGWEVQPPQPPHPRPERSAAVAPHDDGITSPYAVFYNLGGQVQPWQPPHPRPERAGAIARGDDGNENQFAVWYNAGWEIQPPQPPTQPTVRQRYAGTKGRTDFGIYSPFVKWNEENTTPYRWPFRAPGKTPDNGDQGIQAPIPTTPPSGYEQTPFAYRKPRPNVGWPDWNDDGNNATFAVWQNAGWEFTPPITKAQPKNVAVTKGRGEFAYQPFQPYGWEIQPPQPPHPKPERSAAIAGNENIFTAGIQTFAWSLDPQFLARFKRPMPVGFPDWNDDGNNNTYRPWTYMGWEVQPPQPPYHRPPANAIRQRIGSSFLLSTAVPYVDDPRPFQPPAWPRVQNRAGQAAVTGFSYSNQWVNAGWEVAPYQPQHPRPERFAAIARGDDGNQGRFSVWQNDGWEPIGHQPQHPRPERSAAIAPWSDGRAKFAVWYFTGWEIQPVQPGHPRPERSGSVARGDDGIEAKFLFVPAAVSDGWEIQIWQPPHPRPEQRSAGLIGGDQGNEKPFIFVPPPPPVQPPPPGHGSYPNWKPGKKPVQPIWDRKPKPASHTDAPPLKPAPHTATPALRPKLPPFELFGVTAPIKIPAVGAISLREADDAATGNAAWNDDELALQLLLGNIED